MNHAWSAAAAVLVPVAAAGCPCTERTRIPPEQIIAESTANTARTNALIGRIGVSIRAPGRSLYFPMRGRLAFMKPGFLHLEITKLGSRYIDLGADGHEYWLWSREALLDEYENTLRTGSVSRLDRSGGLGLIIRPEMVADALGVAPLVPPPGEGTAVLPERYEEAYVLNYVRPAGRSLRLIKKATIDPFTGRTTRIDYFAPNGTRVLFITIESTYEVHGIRLIDDVTLHFPAVDASVHFDLDSLALRPSLPEAIFQRPAFPGARHLDLDAAP